MSGRGPVSCTSQLSISSSTRRLFLGCSAVVTPLTDRSCLHTRLCSAFQRARLLLPPDCSAVAILLPEVVSPCCRSSLLLCWTTPPQQSDSTVCTLCHLFSPILTPSFASCLPQLSPLRLLASAPSSDDGAAMEPSSPSPSSLATAFAADATADMVVEAEMVDASASERGSEQHGWLFRRVIAPSRVPPGRRRSNKRGSTWSSSTVAGKRRGLLVSCWIWRKQQQQQQQQQQQRQQQQQPEHPRTQIVWMGSSRTWSCCRR